MAEENIEGLEFKLIEAEEWRAFAWHVAVRDGKKYLKGSSGEVIYRKKDDGYACVNCGSTIMAVKVAHPIWDGPFPGSGSGKCKYKEAPYCPNCEVKPDFHGKQIENGPDVDGLW